MRPAFRWAAVLAFAAAIFALSSRSHLDPVEPPALLLDKVAHFVEYFLFAATLAWACVGSGLSARRAVVLAFVVAAAYGVTDEVHQAFVVGREASVFDWVADACGAGALAGWGIFRATRPTRPKET